MSTPDPMLEALLKATVDSGASDLHLTVGRPATARRDGVLVSFENVAVLTAEEVERMVYSLLDERKVAELKEDRQVDFSFGLPGVGRFRANAFRQRGNLALALRVVPFRVRTLEELGAPSACTTLLNKPYGIVLVVGPTGSGKSTTLAAMIDRINDTKPVHILTIEDPVEYLHHHKMAMVNQREVGTDVGSFTDGLRSALREDPDVVLLGEMRDLDSIQIALSLAETGHLVFATLHTNDAAQALDRIIDIFPGERRDQIQIMLAGALQGVISQRLMPAIGGGRVAGYEVMIANEAIRNLVREGKSRQMRNMISTGAEQGMQTIEMDLARLVAAGLISIETAMESQPVPEGGAGTARHGPCADARSLDAVVGPGRLVRFGHLRRSAGLDACRFGGTAAPAAGSGRLVERLLSRSHEDVAVMVVKKNPYKNLAGVTPCPGGWLVLPARLAGITVAAEDAFVLPKLFEVLDFRPTFEAAAINVPMGWFDTPSGQYRPCDREAREYVGWPRVIGISGTPCREAVRASNTEAARLEPWMTKHDQRRLRWLREAEHELQPYPLAQLLLGESRRVVHGDEQRRTVEDVAVSRGRAPRAPGTHPSASARRRRRGDAHPARWGRVGPHVAGSSAAVHRSPRLRPGDQPHAARPVLGRERHAHGNRPLTPAPDCDEPNRRMRLRSLIAGCLGRVAMSQTAVCGCFAHRGAPGPGFRLTDQPLRARPLIGP